MVGMAVLGHPVHDKLARNEQPCFSKHLLSSIYRQGWARRHFLYRCMGLFGNPIDDP